jgi:hypothetical protein
MPKSSVADHSLEWHSLVVSVQSNADDMPYVAELADELKIVLDAVKALESERMLLDARSQQITRDMDALKSRGRVVASRVRSGLKTRYGFSSEKLAEFGVRPRRRRVRDEMAERAVMDKITDPEPVS